MCDPALTKEEKKRQKPRGYVSSGQVSLSFHIPRPPRPLSSIKGTARKQKKKKVGVGYFPSFPSYLQFFAIYSLSCGKERERNPTTSLWIVNRTFLQSILSYYSSWIASLDSRTWASRLLVMLPIFAIIRCLFIFLMLFLIWWELLFFLFRFPFYCNRHDFNLFRYGWTSNHLTAIVNYPRRLNMPRYQFFYS